MRLRSVYLGMFEQTLLTHPASARKTGALAASFVAQSAIVGVLVIGPLLYTKALPLLPLLDREIFVIPVRPVTPPSVAEVATTAAPSSNAPSYRVFVPTQVPTGPIRNTPVETNFVPLDLPAATGIPIAVSVGIPAVSGVVGPPPAVEVVKTVVAPPVADAKPIRVSSIILSSKLIKQVLPKYPTLARQTRVSGSVHLLGTIAKDGRVQDLRVLDGHPLLRQAALEAVSQWVYSPTILNGQPVEVEAPIEVNFTLQ